MKIDKTELKELIDEFEQNPSVDVCTHIALLYYLDNNKKKEKEYYQKALQMQLEIVKDKDISDYPDFIALGGIYGHLGDDFNARKIYERVLNHLKTLPENTKILLSLGDLYGLLQQEDKAIECYEKVLESDPNNTDALEDLMHLYAFITRPCYNLAKAKEIASKILELEPDDDMAKYILEKEDIDFDPEIIRECRSFDEKRLIIDSSENGISEDVIKYVKKTRWWVFIIFGACISYIVFLITYICNHRLFY